MYSYTLAKKNIQAIFFNLTY